MSVEDRMLECVGGHKGPVKLEWFEELNDDRYDLLIIQRCQHCGIPAGAEDYATYEERQAHGRGEQPTRVPQ